MYLYNDLVGADQNFALRNFLNVFGLLCFGLGGLIIASGGGHSLTSTAYLCFTLLGAVIFFTVATQDFADMKGDAARRRRTLPLAYGEKVARHFVAVAVVVSSPAYSAFWNLGIFGYLLPAALGMLLGYWMAFLRGVAVDETSWILWCIWVSVLYMLPLFSRIQHPIV